MYGLHLAGHPQFLKTSEGSDRFARLSCTYCPHMASDENNLSIHMAAHATECELRCRYCPYDAHQTSSIVSHCALMHSSYQPNWFNKRTREDKNGPAKLVSICPNMCLKRVKVNPKSVQKRFKRIRIEVDSDSETDDLNLLIRLKREKMKGKHDRPLHTAVLQEDITVDGEELLTDGRKHVGTTAKVTEVEPMSDVPSTIGSETRCDIIRDTIQDQSKSNVNSDYIKTQTSCMDLYKTTVDTAKNKTGSQGDMGMTTGTDDSNGDVTAAESTTDIITLPLDTEIASKTSGAITQHEQEQSSSVKNTESGSNVETVRQSSVSSEISETEVQDSNGLSVGDLDIDRELRDIDRILEYARSATVQSPESKSSLE